LPAIRVKDVREMSSEQRRKRAAELQTELVRLRTMVKAGGSIENTGRVRELRKAIARILTVEKESHLSTPSGEKKR
jgi:large subunit ribosomal protein L29